MTMLPMNNGTQEDINAPRIFTTAMDTMINRVKDSVLRFERGMHVANLLHDADREHLELLIPLIPDVGLVYVPNELIRALLSGMLIDTPQEERLALYDKVIKILEG